MPFQMPRHPGSEPALPPLRNADGTNRFADDTPAAATAANPYAASAAAGGVSYQPRDHEAVYSHRAPLVLRLGTLGVLSAVVGAGGITLAVWYQAPELMFCFAGMLLVSWVLCGTGWLLGRQDLAAMRVGAMARDGWGKTRLGHSLAALGVLTALAALAIGIVRLVLFIGESS